MNSDRRRKTLLYSSIAFVRAVAYESDPEDPIAAVQAAFALTGAPA